MSSPSQMTSGNDGPSQAEQTIRMTPEQEQAALTDATEGVEPADEGVGVFTDQDGDDHTAN